MRRRLLILGATVGIVAVVAAVTSAVIIAGGWTDTQQASGNVTISGSVPDLLYICEPTTPGANDPSCPGTDDSGADELILESDEQLLPGGPNATWDFTLKNLDPDVAWDISGFTATWTETIDPGNDCSSVPSYQIHTYTADDDHGSAAIAGSPAFNAWTGGGNKYVHVAPGQADDMRISVSIPGTFPIECVGNAWDLDIDFQAEVH